ncbi:MAG: MBL fold metallo-hydrolase [Dermatophilaceae bacterium]|nr:MBL fold metallo-hydrolase [Intrasporangiaceae bacterium]
MSTRTRFAIASGAAGALGALAVATSRTSRDVGEQMGGVAEGARLARMQRSAQWRDGRFHNLDRSAAGMTGPDAATARDAAKRFVSTRALREPPFPVPLRSEALRLPSHGVQFAWLGHASVLVSLGGEHVLFDPVWSERCSPSVHVGPRRMHAVPFDLSALPPLAAVVISHDHYDHLDMPTIQALDRLQHCRFVVPLGIGAHLERWGVDESRILELDWSESTSVGSVELTAVSSQHFSGRGIRRNPTLWASWVAASPAGSVYFSGDTGYFDGFERIGRDFGPFDAAFMAVGMYDPAWRPVHLDPEEAVQATAELGARLAVPIHWCTFALAPHAWSEPPERFVAAAERASVAYVIPEVGQAVDAAVAPSDPGTGVRPWWRP